MCEKKTPALKQHRRPINEVTLAAPVTPSSSKLWKKNVRWRVEKSRRNASPPARQREHYAKY
ncbi:hypothetical protein T4B_13277, partial [Trichinella pseudospiralis]